MLTRTHISSFIGLTIFIWIVVLLIQGTAISIMDFLKPFSIVTGIMFTLATIFNKWAWAWKIFQGWYVKHPDLRGTWQVVLESEHRLPSANEKIPPIFAYVAVQQSLTSLKMRLMTLESQSKLIAHCIDQQDDGCYCVSGIYRNVPKIGLQGTKSAIHHGSFILEVHGDPPESLAGHYWTDRKTRGSMQLSNRHKMLFDTYEQAKECFDA